MSLAQKFANTCFVPVSFVVMRRSLSVVWKYSESYISGGSTSAVCKEVDVGEHDVLSNDALHQVPSGISVL